MTLVSVLRETLEFYPQGEVPVLYRAVLPSYQLGECCSAAAFRVLKSSNVSADWDYAFSSWTSEIGSDEKHTNYWRSL